jgi:hypothetical protein
VLVPVLVGLALAAFAWPAARLGPRDLPIGVVAPAGAGGAIERRLAGDALEVHRFADQASARAAIADRDVYGAIVAGPQGTTVLTASAASPLVAQLLQQAAAGGGPAAATSPGGAASVPVRVVDVVPADPDDPPGAALAASVLTPGAGGSLLRSTAFFDGAGAAGPLTVLAAWVVLGLALGWLAALRRPRRSPVGTPEADPAAVS